MFAHLDADLAARHQAILLGREGRRAEAETYLMVHDNGNGTYSGRFVVPELHGAMLTQCSTALRGRWTWAGPDGCTTAPSAAPTRCSTTPAPSRAGSRPFAWCEIHHLAPWSRGGPTDLVNGLPLCGHHHRRAHDPGLDLRRRTDGEWALHRRT